MSERTKEKVMQRLIAFRDELKTLNDQFIKLQSMELILRQDVLDCEPKEDQADSTKRSFVRAVFALIEGSVFNLKQVALNVSAHKPNQFTKAELVMLEEVSYDLNDKGETNTQMKFLPLTKNIRFAFKTAARAFSVEYKLVVDDVGWSKFKDALVIRNRVTHPKRTDDLKLTDEEVQIVADAGTWFLHNQGNLFQQFVDRMQALEDTYKEKENVLRL